MKLSTFSQMLLVLTSLDAGLSFGIVGGRSVVSRSALQLSSSSSNGGDDDAGGTPASSSIAGNRREPTVSEIAVMDDMITKLCDAAPYELPNAVSKAVRVVSSPRFFLRIAERADMEVRQETKDKLAALAANLVRTLEAVVNTAEETMDERASDVERVLQAAAEPGSGELLVPLSRDRADAMRVVLTGLDPATLDEGFLTTVDAWMNKSSQDGMDGMVTILQTVLQLYAGTAVSRARSALSNGGDNRSTGAAQLEKLLAMNTDDWDAELQAVFTQGTVTPATMMGEVQRTVESVVLGLDNGSMAQRVQAEYLRELVLRVETTQKNLGL